MKAKKVFENLEEGVGDEYLTRKHQMPDEFEDFEKQYKTHKLQTMKNEDKNQIIKRIGDWALIKNPSSIDLIGKSARGVIDEDGNLYIENFSERIHHDLLKILYDKGILKGTFSKRWTKQYPDDAGFLTVQRFKDTPYIAIGESNRLIYDPEDWKKHRERYSKFIKKAQMKNPKLNIVNRLVGAKFKNMVESESPNYMRFMLKEKFV